MIRIRAPNRSEAGLVADLVLLSDCGLLTSLFGPEARTLLAFLQGRPSNPFSAENTLVIADETESGVRREGDRGLLGAAVGSLGSRMRAESLPTARALFAWYGLRLAARLPRLVRAGGATAQIGDSDFYLSNIALFPQARRRGLGRELLASVEERAFRLGARQLVLDVEGGNDDAQAFYERLGYREERELVISLGGAGHYLFHRMARRR